MITRPRREWLEAGGFQMAAPTQTRAAQQAKVVVGANNVVRVNVSAETLYNLEATQQLTRAILGRLGCGGCHSGVQILFQQEETEFNI